MEYDSNNHSVFKLYYHLIMSIKYRRKVLNDEITLYAKNRFIEIGTNYNIILEEFNCDKDHVHILFRAHPNSEISKFINVYKSSTSRMIKKNLLEQHQQKLLTLLQLTCQFLIDLT
jgi:putative transposase